MEELVYIIALTQNYSIHQSAFSLFQIYLLHCGTSKQKLKHDSSCGRFDLYPYELEYTINTRILSLGARYGPCVLEVRTLLRRNRINPCSRVPDVQASRYIDV